MLLEYEFDVIISAIMLLMYASKDDVEWFNDKVERRLLAVHIDEDALNRANEFGINVIYGHVIPI